MTNFILPSSVFMPQVIPLVTLASIMRAKVESKVIAVAGLGGL
jgi:hypothetical protein